MIAQDHIADTTPAGTALLADGATFKVWAPNAEAVYLHGTFGGVAVDGLGPDRLMVKDPRGYWTGFQAGAKASDLYRFWIVGTGTSGYKRDPRARELAQDGFPNSAGVLREPAAYPWHDHGFRTPDFADMVVYQLHVGTYAVPAGGTPSNLLDVACKVPYIAALGVNVLQPLPIDEQEANPNLGYGGADLFAPDFPYIATVGLTDYLTTINGILGAKQVAPLRIEDITAGPDQVKVLVDLCHLHGIAVVFDVVYNHAGGFTANNALDDNCLYFMDRRPNHGSNNNDSLYFTDQDRGTGGLAFALWNEDVRRLLFDNATAYVDEYHADGFRYDEISTLLSTSQGSGWEFCRSLTDRLRARQPRLLQNAEFWPGRFDDIPGSALPIVAPAASGGAGFDVVQHDYLRNVLRAAIGAASAGGQAAVPMAAIAPALYPPGFDHGWRAVTCIENHDVVLAGRQPRIPMLADSSNSRSWYARSRTRVANAILLTAPGIPQIFMGQEVLEDKPWDVDPKGPDLIFWEGLTSGSDRSMVDHLRFMQDAVRLRTRHPALRGDQVNVFHVSDDNRVLAFHRWLEGRGEDVVVIASLAESAWERYELGFPSTGQWDEVFNSDVYDHWVNPWVAGNGSGLQAGGPPMHGFAASASVVIPANGVVVFAKRP